MRERRLCLRRDMSTRIEGSRARIVEYGLEVTISTDDGDFGVIVREEEAEKAVEVVGSEIARIVKGLDPTDQRGIDTLICNMDGTTDRSDFTPGGILGVSMATALAGAAAAGRTLTEYLADLGNKSELRAPVPVFGTKSSNNVLVIPFGDKDFNSAMKTKDYFEQESGSFGTDDVKEQFEKCLKVLVEKNLLGEVAFGLKNSQMQISDLHNFVKRYPIVMLINALEDGDETVSAKLVKELGSKMQIFPQQEMYTEVTSKIQALQKGLVTGVFFDLASIGTVSAAIDTCKSIEREGGAALMYSCGPKEAKSPSYLQFVSSLLISQPIDAVLIDRQDKQLCEKIQHAEKEVFKIK